MYVGTYCLTALLSVQVPLVERCMYDLLVRVYRACAHTSVSTLSISLHYRYSAAALSRTPLLHTHSKHTASRPGLHRGIRRHTAINDNGCVGARQGQQDISYTVWRGKRKLRSRRHLAHSHHKRALAHTVLLSDCFHDPCTLTSLV